MRLLLAICAIVTTAMSVLIFRKVSIMARSVDQIRQDISDINAVTNTLATLVTDLRDKVKTDMTPEEVAEVHASLGAIRDSLGAIAADPNNPAPPAPNA